MAKKSYGEWIRSNPPLPTKKYKKEHMAQQTAVEWLREAIEYNLYMHPSNTDWLPSLVEQSKEMEKHQHGQTWDAAIKAHDDRGHVHARSLVDFDEYFEEQFKK